VEIEDLVKKIQELVNHRRSGFTREEDRELSQITKFRDSFRYKHGAVYFHFELIKTSKKKVEEEIERAHKNKELLTSEKNLRKSLRLNEEVKFKSTILLEDIIYHLTSLIDNLPKIIGVYFKTVRPELGFRTAKKQLNQNHTKNLDITKLINKNWDEWIEKLKEFRASIFHHHSKTVQGILTVRVGKNIEGNQQFKEEILINIPKELRELFKYGEGNVEIEQFCNDIMGKSYEFFNDLFDLLIIEHKKYVQELKEIK